MYKLRTILKGHELDVRGITAADDSTLVTVSRDATARLWNIAVPLDYNSDGTICFNSPTGAFLNSVVDVDSPLTGKLVACGGKDAIVYLTETHETFLKPGDDVGKFQLVGHSGNVCSLDYQQGNLISGSWDCTAKTWDLASFTVRHDLIGHSAAVWDAKVLDAEQGTYLTCSADKTIRKWKGAKEIACFKGHSDVVRKLLVLPGGKSFASASNDCTIKIWDSVSGALQHTLKGHDSFVYDLALLPNGDIVSTAEDRSVRVWRDYAILQVITLPCISVWCVCTLPNNDFAVGCSDKQVYVFTQDSGRFATKEAIVALEDAVHLSAISEQSLDDLKKTDVPGYERLDQPGKEEGHVITVKSPVGVIEAHQWSAGQWVKIGDVVNNAGGSSSKVQYQGQEYDYVFDVDVEDGKPPLKLPYNATDNPYAAAEKFLANNDLPASYTEEVVQFINKNTGGFQMGGPVADNPYHQRAKSVDSIEDPPFFPETTAITYDDFKVASLSNGFSKVNAQQHAFAFDSDEVARVQTSLSDLNSKEAKHLIATVVPRILSKWDKALRLIGFDLLRIAISRVSTMDLIQSTQEAEAIYTLLFATLEEITEQDVTLFMMMAKVLSNLANSTLFMQIFLTVEDNGLVQLNEHFDKLSLQLTVLVKIMTSSEVASAQKHFGLAYTALALYLFNLLARFKSYLGANAATLAKIMAVLEDIGEDLARANEEASYRLVVAYGNFHFYDRSLAQPHWYAVIKTLHDTSRFQTVYKEIEES